MDENIRLISALVIVCLISGISLSVVYAKTIPMINRNKAEVLKRAILEVNPKCMEYNKIDSLEILDEKEGLTAVYKCEDVSGNNNGYALVVEGVGFGGNMKILVGINDKYELTGIRVMEHLETPGLGEKITEEQFLSQFRGKLAPLREDEFDTITGATISSSKVIELVVNGVNKLRKSGE